MWSRRNKKVAVAMSGGVDSSVAALLCMKRYRTVAGFFVRGYNVDGCQDKDVDDARAVAQQLGIPFYVLDLEKEYKERVVEYMLEGYRKGITPNPDVVCNSQIKFGLLYDHVSAMGFDYVATGHYACQRREGPRYPSERLIPFSRAGNLQDTKVGVYAGRDENKDQSYFLWQVPRERFEHILFPLGKLKKEKVRMLAKKAGLVVADKKDSQGVCFLGKFDFKEFLQQHIPSQKGEIVDVNGVVVGEHEGVWFYTLGQRRGFVNTAGVPFFVVKKDIEKNQLIVAYEGDDALLSDQVVLTDLNFLDEATRRVFESGSAVDVFTRLRYRAPLQKATLKKNEAVAVLIFDKKSELFPASGQSAVWYNKKGKMLGGGIIQ
jgi:tRNA-specific 2-thiouridylase